MVTVVLVLVLRGRDPSGLDSWRRPEGSRPLGTRMGGPRKFKFAGTARALRLNAARKFIAGAGSPVLGTKSRRQSRHKSAQICRIRAKKSLL